MNNATNDTVLSPKRFDAVVMDLDGVITQTASVHAEAWKEMFDDYLAEHTAEDETYKPFDIESDYRRYVDGKPRYDGVQSFLESRGIELPRGEPDNGSDKTTVCGLGNRKNELFLNKLRREGVAVYPSSISLIRRLRRAGVHLAVVSSSRNCQAVLESAGISDLFDARVDGRELQRLNLAGKPAPDMFVEACQRVACEPQRAVGIEDATAGVKAAHAAGFGCVVGVNRGEQADALLEYGADVVVRDLEELQLASNSRDTLSARQLPSALNRVNEIVPGNNCKPALFLDYDGTLTPIVSHPDDAILSEGMRESLRRISDLCPVAVISGRDLKEVRERVDIEKLWYAGSHGFDIAGPAGKHIEYQEGREYLPALDDAEQNLRDALATVSGSLVERKRFSIAVHYRQVAHDEVSKVKRAVDQIHSVQPELRLTSGKKVFELQPDIDWNKGKALRWLMQSLDLDSAYIIPVYIGDDVTDEDAFKELATDGVGILVAQEDQTTCADYRLDKPGAVEQFLHQLSDRLSRSGA